MWVLWFLPNSLSQPRRVTVKFSRKYKESFSSQNSKHASVQTFAQQCFFQKSAPKTAETSNNFSPQTVEWLGARDFLWILQLQRLKNPQSKSFRTLRKTTILAFCVWTIKENPEYRWCFPVGSTPTTYLPVNDGFPLFVHTGHGDTHRRGCAVSLSFPSRYHGWPSNCLDRINEETGRVFRPMNRIRHCVYHCRRTLEANLSAGKFLWAYYWDTSRQSKLIGVLDIYR